MGHKRHMKKLKQCDGNSEKTAVPKVCSPPNMKNTDLFQLSRSGKSIGEIHPYVGAESEEECHFGRDSDEQDSDFEELVASITKGDKGAGPSTISPPISPHLIGKEDEFPALSSDLFSGKSKKSPTKSPVISPLVMSPSAAPKQVDKPKNVGRKGKPKVLVNSGFGDRLQYSSSGHGPVQIRRSEALSSEAVWGFTLLGRFVGRFPGLKAVNTIRDTWVVQSKMQVERGVLFFSFNSAADRDRIRDEGPYSIYGRTLLLKDLPSMFTFSKDIMATIPLWVRIHDLPKEFWTNDILARLGSRIGTPLYLDPVTEGKIKGTYARILAEVNLAKELIRHIEVEVDDGTSLVCSVMYENVQKFCHGCNGIGHKLEQCHTLEGANQNQAAASDVARQPTVEMEKGESQRQNLDHSMADYGSDLVPSRGLFEESSDHGNAELVGSILALESLAKPMCRNNNDGNLNPSLDDLSNTSRAGQNSLNNMAEGMINSEFFEPKSSTIESLIPSEDESLPMNSGNMDEINSDVEMEKGQVELQSEAILAIKKSEKGKAVIHSEETNIEVHERHIVLALKCSNGDGPPKVHAETARICGATTGRPPTTRHHRK